MVDLFFLGWVSQEVAWMKGGDQYPVFEFDHLPSYLADGGIVACKPSVACGAESYQDLGIDDLDLLEEVGDACLGLFGGRDSIARRAAFDDVGDIDFTSWDFKDVFDHLGQQLSGTPDEGSAGLIFRSTWSLTDKHHFGIWITFTEDYVLSRFGQIAQVAFTYDLSKSFEVVGKSGALNRFRDRVHIFISQPF